MVLKLQTVCGIHRSRSRYHLYEVVSLHTCVLPYKYRKIQEMLLKLLEVRCELMGSRSRYQQQAESEERAFQEQRRRLLAELSEDRERNRQTLIEERKQMEADMKSARDASTAHRITSRGLGLSKWL